VANSQDPSRKILIRREKILFNNGFGGLLRRTVVRFGFPGNGVATRWWAGTPRRAGGCGFSAQRIVGRSSLPRIRVFARSISHNSLIQ